MTIGESIKMNEKEFLEQLYHDLIHACRKARNASKYFKKKGTQNHIILKAQGKVTVLTGLIIRLENEFGYRIKGEKYIDTIEKAQKNTTLRFH